MENGILKDEELNLVSGGVLIAGWEELKKIRKANNNVKDSSC